MGYMRLVLMISIVAFAALAQAAELPRTSAPEGAGVYIISPVDGTVTGREVTVQFGLSGMGVAPAGVDKPNTGHHHLLIDVDQPPPSNQPIPADDQHRHFGGGQTEIMVELEPGQHTLQLLMGDMNHIPHDPPIMSERITITVE